MQPQIFDNETDLRAGELITPPQPEEHLGPGVDPLALEIPDETLVKIIDKQLKDAKFYWNDRYNLRERREKNERALFGREIDLKESRQEIKRYETRYSNNAIYEIEETLKPVAMSRLPDLLITPGNDTNESRQVAEDLSEIINDDIKKRENRQVLGLAFRHLPVYFTACIKVCWNPEKGDQGDYEFKVVHPNRIVLDPSAKTSNVDDMRTVSELLNSTVQNVIMRFPKKKEEIFKKLQQLGRVANDQTDFSWKDLASPIDYWEIHFTWYQKEGTGEIQENLPDIEEPGNKWERIEGVLWKFEDIILDKMKTPNWDYEGEEQVFTYDDPSNEQTKRQLSEQDIMQSLFTGVMPQNLQREQIYFNYFKQPKKPYYFFGYDQWGRSALDETSRIEQNLYNQENLNSIGKQIVDTLKQRMKHIWSTDSGLTSGDIQNLDMEDPKLDALIEGKVDEVHKGIPPERPDAAQFQALGLAKNDMFALAGATALTGQIQTDVATTNQIAREQNFTRADDLVEDTINAASEWMAGWIMQFIKLRYTEEHYRKILGNKGTVTFQKIKRDKIEDGMEVMIKSSGTDKLRTQQNAMDAAKLGPPYSNPLDFFRDMEYSDPEGRTNRGMLLVTNPAGYMAQYGMNLPTVADQAGALLNQQAATQAGVPGQTPPVPPAGGLPQQAPPTGAPIGSAPTDTTAIPQINPVPQGSVRGI